MPKKKHNKDPLYHELSVLLPHLHKTNAFKDLNATIDSLFGQSYKQNFQN